LSPAWLGLFVDERMKRGRKRCFVDGGGGEPGGQTFNEYVDEVRAGILAFAGGSECSEETVLPWFAVWVCAAEEMRQIFDFAFAQEAVWGVERVVSVGYSQGRHYIMAELD